MFERIDHIGVAVEDLDAEIELYGSRFEMRLAHRETVESQGVEAVLLDVGEGHVELLRPLGPETAVVSGTWNGVAIDTEVTRVGSCEEARWQRLKPLVESLD